MEILRLAVEKSGYFLDGFFLLLAPNNQLLQNVELLAILALALHRVHKEFQEEVLVKTISLFHHFPQDV